ncbi:EF-hand calcium-binding domain-containing protein 10 [Clupea harengus]|uniref:EF-hand calcium-binding domain-containing protein 10 n=1 Tax=Clupea harengus TaxID=7950 RepID=A0A6P8F116_CLUHA|nr:EF-hand calcium-binding domain-containing protein 10 [Clupea harengus]
MTSPKEVEATEYLKKHKILELMDNLTSMVFFHRPERPREFLIDQLEQLKLSKVSSSVDSPCLFSNANLEAIFGILDPIDHGYITYSQFKEALTTLGIKNINDCPDGFVKDQITKDTFKKEARKALSESSSTFVKGQPVEPTL